MLGSKQKGLVLYQPQLCYSSVPRKPCPIMRLHEKQPHEWTDYRLMLPESAQSDFLCTNSVMERREIVATKLSSLFTCCFTFFIFYFLFFLFGASLDLLFALFFVFFFFLDLTRSDIYIYIYIYIWHSRVRIVISK